MKVKQPVGTKGSLKWIQKAVATPAVLNSAIRGVVELPADAVIEWVSPRADDDRAEYRDAAFLRRLGRI